MIEVNYATRLDSDGTWSVFHVVTEELAIANGQKCCLLTKEDARAVAHYLNVSKKAANENELLIKGQG